MAHTHTRFGQWFGSTAIVISSTLMLASNAVAQDDMIAMTPHFITTTTADAVLRAGDSDNNYVVANPPADLVLRADAERDNWYRVSYPAGSTAYVKAEDAEISSDGSTLFVKNANAVKAKNTRYGGRGSWRFIRFEPPVKTTDAFKVLSTEQDSSGKSIYVVELPLSARAFVHKSYVRDATPTEIKEHEAGLAMLGLSYTGKVTTPTQTSESNTPTTNENSAENTSATSASKQHIDSN